MGKGTDELVVRAREGSAEAFDALMQLHQQLVFRIAASCTRRREDALDVTQNVFLKVYQNLHRFQDGGRFKSWVARIAYNESINWLRKNKREFLFEELPERREQGIGPERLLVGKEIRGLLMRNISTLNPRYQMTLSLRYFDDLSLREIAEVQDCSINMVKNTLYRSLRQLARNFDEPEAEARSLLSTWEA